MYMTSSLSSNSSEANALLHLEMAMAVGNVAWWEMELPSGNVRFNENKTKMIGREAKDFTHYKHFTDLVHPEDLDRIMGAMQAHLQGSAELYETEYRIKHTDGTYRWFYDRGRIVEKTDDGTIVVMGIVQNITELKTAILELKSRVDEVEKLNSYMLDRELKMAELKAEVAKLQAALAQKQA